MTTSLSRILPLSSGLANQANHAGLRRANARGNRPGRLPNHKSTVPTAYRLPPACPGRLTPWLAPLDNPLILVVRADPYPDEIVSIVDSQGSVSQINPG